MGFRDHLLDHHGGKGTAGEDEYAQGEKFGGVAQGEEAQCGAGQGSVRRRPRTRAPVTHLDVPGPSSPRNGS